MTAHCDLILKPNVCALSCALMDFIAINLHYIIANLIGLNYMRAHENLILKPNPCVLPYALMDFITIRLFHIIARSDWT